MAKQKTRCPWVGIEDQEYTRYHDEEWGVPKFDDRELFEKLVLEGFQAGLSWLTILRKRQNFRAAFDNFDAKKIAAYGTSDVSRLMADAGIVRNRSKVEATISNAKAYLDLSSRQSLSDFLWGFIDGKPIINEHTEFGDVPAQTDISKRISKALKSEGFRFVGPTTVYAFMQSVGMVNDHLVSCHRHAPCAKLQRTPQQEPLACKRMTSKHTKKTPKAKPAAASSPPPPPRAWQRMLSGRRLDLLDPSPLDIEIEDIAHGLARVARWNGQTIGDHALSVAQHVLVVEEIAANRNPKWSSAWRLATLLHDAQEYVVGDLISPFKTAIGLDYKAFEIRLNEAIHLRFGLPPTLPDEVAAEIKTADRIAAYFEATVLAGFERNEALRFFGKPTGISTPLRTRLEKLTPLPVAEAQELFLRRFALLSKHPASR